MEIEKVVKFLSKDDLLEELKAERVKEEVRKMFINWNSSEVLNFSSNQSYVYEKEELEDNGNENWA
mgnify:CR=1 FL=1